MRDLSKVNQKSLQQTWELHHAALIPCPFTLRLQQQMYSLEKGSTAQQAALPRSQKRPSATVRPKAYRSQLASVSPSASCCTQSQVHPLFVLTAQELAQSTEPPLTPPKRELFGVKHMHHSAFPELDTRNSIDSSENQTTRHAALGL